MSLYSNVQFRDLGWHLEFIYAIWILKFNIQILIMEETKESE